MIYKANGEAMREYSGLVAQIARLDYEAERIAQARAQAIEAVKAWEEAHVETPRHLPRTPTRPPTSRNKPFRGRNPPNN
jgi:hypothetical protein